MDVRVDTQAGGEFCQTPLLLFHQMGTEILTQDSENDVIMLEVING